MANGTIAKQSNIQLKRVRVTVPANVGAVNVTASLAAGETFEGWVSVLSSGIVTAVTLGNPDQKSTTAYANSYGQEWQIIATYMVRVD